MDLSAEEDLWEKEDYFDTEKVEGEDDEIEEEEDSEETSSEEERFDEEIGRASDDKTVIEFVSPPKRNYHKPYFDKFNMFGNANQNMERTKEAVLEKGTKYYTKETIKHFHLDGSTDQTLKMIKDRNVIDQFRVRFETGEDKAIRLQLENIHDFNPKLRCPLIKSLIGGNRGSYEKWQDINDSYCETRARKKNLLPNETNIIIIGTSIYAALRLAQKISLKFGQIVISVQELIKEALSETEKLYYTRQNEEVKVSTDVQVSGEIMKDLFLKSLSSEIVHKNGYIICGLHLLIRQLLNVDCDNYWHLFEKSKIRPVDVIVHLRTRSCDIYNQHDDTVIDPFQDNIVLFKKVFYEGLYTMENLRRKYPKINRMTRKFYDYIGHTISYDEAILTEYEDLKEILDKATKIEMAKGFTGVGIENLCKLYSYDKAADFTSMELLLHTHMLRFFKEHMVQWDPRFYMEMESYLPTVYHFHTFLKKFPYLRLYKKPTCNLDPIKESGTIIRELDEETKFGYFLHDSYPFNGTKKLSADFSLEPEDPFQLPTYREPQEYEQTELPSYAETQEEYNIFPEDDKAAIGIEAYKKYGYQLSEWDYRCPVSFYENEFSQGNWSCFVRLQDKIYYCSNNDKLQKFIKNPEKYLKETLPVALCKVAVTGPRFCGKTYVSDAIATYFNAKVIRVEKVLEKCLKKKIVLYNERLKKMVEEIILEESNRQFYFDYAEMENSKLKKAFQLLLNLVRVITLRLRELKPNLKPKLRKGLCVAKESGKGTGELANIFEYLNILRKKEMAEIYRRLLIKANSVLPAYLKEDICKEDKFVFDQFMLMKLDFYNRPNFIEEMLNSPHLLFKYIPKEFLPMDPPDPLRLQDIKHLDRKIDFAMERLPKCPPLTNTEIAHAIMHEIVKLEKRVIGKFLWYGGWVLDGVPLNVEIWHSLNILGILPYNVIYLRDPLFSYQKQIEMREQYSHKLTRTEEIAKLLTCYREDRHFSREIEFDLKDIHSDFKTTYLFANFCTEVYYELPITYIKWYQNSDLHRWTRKRKKPREIKETKSLHNFFSNSESNNWYHEMWLLNEPESQEELTNSDRNLFIISEYLNWTPNYLIKIDLQKRGPCDVVPEILDNLSGGAGAPCILSEESSRRRNNDILAGKSKRSRDRIEMCPVMMKEGKTKKGTIQITFMGDVYWLCSKICFRKFRINPDQYVQIDCPNDLFPRTRISICGPPGSLSYAYSRELALHFGIRFIDGIEEVYKILLPPGIKPVGSLMEEYADRRFTQLDDLVNSRQMRARLNMIRNYLARKESMPVKYLKLIIGLQFKKLDGCILHNLPYLTYDLIYMKKFEYLPELLIFFESERNDCIQNLLKYVKYNWKQRLNEITRSTIEKSIMDLYRWKRTSMLRFYKIIKAIIYDYYPETEEEVDGEESTEEKIPKIEPGKIILNPEASDYTEVTETTSSDLSQELSSRKWSIETDDYYYDFGTESSLTLSDSIQDEQSILQFQLEDTERKSKLLILKQPDILPPNYNLQRIILSYHEPDISLMAKKLSISTKLKDIIFKMHEKMKYSDPILDMASNRYLRYVKFDKSKESSGFGRVENREELEYEEPLMDFPGEYGMEEKEKDFKNGPAHMFRKYYNRLFLINPNSYVSSRMKGLFNGLLCKEMEEPIDRTIRARSPWEFSIEDLELIEMICPVNRQSKNYMEEEAGLIGIYLEIFNKITDLIIYLKTAKLGQFQNITAKLETLREVDKIGRDKEIEREGEYMMEGATGEVGEGGWRRKQEIEEEPEEGPEEGSEEESEEEPEEEVIAEQVEEEESEVGSEEASDEEYTDEFAEVKPKPQRLNYSIKEANIGHILIESNLKMIVKYLKDTLDATSLKGTWPLNIQKEIINEVVTSFYDDYLDNVDHMKILTEDFEIRACEYSVGQETLGKLFEITKNNFVISENFEKVTIAEASDVDKLLRDGYFHLSKFGRVCPVMLFENRINITGNIFYLIHRNYLYFIDSKQSKNKFIKNPLKYISQDSFRIPDQLKTIIFGYPEHLKEKVSTGLEEKYGFPEIRIGEIMHFVLNRMPWMLASDCINAFCNLYLDLPVYLVVICIEIWLNTAINNTFGWTLVGLDFTEEFFHLFDYFQLKPDFIFVFYPTDMCTYEMNNYKLMLQIRNNPTKYRFKTRAYLMADPIPIKLRKIQFTEIAGKMFEISSKNVCVLTNLFAYALLKKLICALVSSRINKDRCYLHTYLIDKIIPLSYYNVLPQLNQLNGERFFCPICLIDWQCFSQPNLHNFNKYLIQYLGKLVWFCKIHFLKSPRDYVKNYIIKSMAAEKRTRTQRKSLVTIRRRQAEFNGYCPICLSRQGIDKNKFIKGKTTFTISFNNKLYFACSERCRRLFIETPKRFIIQENPVIVTLFDSSTSMNELNEKPFLAYISQLSILLLEGLKQLECHRPLFAGMTIKESACHFLAYFLLSHHPNGNLDVKEMAKTLFTKFKNKCKKYLKPKSFDQLQEEYKLQNRNIKLQNREYLIEIEKYQKFYEHTNIYKLPNYRKIFSDIWQLYHNKLIDLAETSKGIIEK